MVLQNSTMAMDNNLIAMVPTLPGWFVTVIVFVIITTTIFFISKNFRKLIYGAIIMLVSWLIYLPSRFIGSEVTNNNYQPLIEFIKIIVGIVLAIIIGHYIRKIKFVQKMEKKLR